LIHADARFDNFFYDERDGRKVLVDFQVMHPGSPGRELATIFLFELSPQARRENQVRLVEEYRKICGDGTADEYWQAYREGLVFGCIWVIILLAILDLNDPKTEKVLPAADRAVESTLRAIEDEKLLRLAEQILSSNKKTN
jgi:thiamine kinase-like enzyme